MYSLIVIGIDPSVRATAIVAVPLDWGGDWSKVRSHVVHGSSAKKGDLAGRIRRNDRLAVDVQDWIDRLPPHLARSARIEDYSYGSKFGASYLGELGGSIRTCVLDVCAELREVPIKSARKTLLGKLPLLNQKGAVVTALKAVGASFGTIDEYEAMCIANHGLSQLGGHCFLGEQT